MGSKHFTPVSSKELFPFKVIFTSPIVTFSSFEGLKINEIRCTEEGQIPTQFNRAGGSKFIMA